LKSKPSPLHSPLGSLLLDSHKTTKAEPSPIQSTHEPQHKLPNSTEYNITGSHVASLSSNESERQDPVRESQQPPCPPHSTIMHSRVPFHPLDPLVTLVTLATLATLTLPSLPKKKTSKIPNLNGNLQNVVRSRDTHPTPPSPLTTLVNLARHRPSQPPSHISSTLSMFPPASLRASPPSINLDLDPKFSHVRWCFSSCGAAAGLAPRQDTLSLLLLDVG
jgi:hypothetical protein